MRILLVTTTLLFVIVHEMLIVVFPPKSYDTPRKLEHCNALLSWYKDTRL